MQLAPGAWRKTAVVVLAGLAASLRSRRLGGLLVALAPLVLAFYRDPDRDPPASGVVAPADGRVSVVRAEGDRVRVGVFMNLTDVHVNRAPVPGEVLDVEHEPGGHWPAFSKEAERNERVRVTLDSGFEVTQIAGAVARRITPYVDRGDAVGRGERIGHIAFGSRVDVLLPPEYGLSDVRVARGEPVLAGETLLAGGPEDTRRRPPSSGS